ncbi:MAG: hypothetical protein G8345_00100 [Magnetococcales bacterium]|nr:hypothetical protein [Magnetococcales bacterium]NGZ25267.1 hypothetical protein [Magnetococcales bacterium]
MNRLPGTLVKMERDGGMILMQVMAMGCTFTAMLLTGSEEPCRWQVGDAVTLLFKESEVSLAKGLSGLTSLRNRHGGCIEEIQRGRLISRVIFRFQESRLSSIITTGSVERLSLQVGDEVEWLVKANEMAVEGREE